MARTSSLKTTARNWRPLLTVAAIIILILLLIAYFTPKTKYTGAMASATFGGFSAYEGFENTVKGKLMLFHAEWCPHCKQYEKDGTFEKLSSDSRVSHIAFEKIDVDKQADVAAKYGVPSFPTLVLADADGEKLGTFDGNRNDIDEIIKFINSKIQA